MIAVSACLLGENCKYSGGNNQNQNVISFLQNKSYIKICPEIMGGLSTPRPPSEIIGSKVVTNTGQDLTKEFNLGSKRSLSICQENKITLAILKSNSPSCGYKNIYDGSFSGKLINGQGVTAKLLAQHSIKIIDEHDLEHKEEDICQN